MGPPKIKGIEDTSSQQEDEKRRQNQTRKELTFIAQRTTQFYEKCVKDCKCVTMGMGSLVKDQHCFLMDLLPLPLPIPKATQTQCDGGDSRLALKLAMIKYYKAE